MHQFGKTLRTNPPGQRTLRTNPPGFGKNTTNEPTGAQKTRGPDPPPQTRAAKMRRTNPTAADACAAELRRTNPSLSRRPRCGSRQNEAISRNPLVRTRSLPAGSDDGSFLRNEANHQIGGLRRGARPTTKLRRTNPTAERWAQAKTRRTNPTAERWPQAENAPNEPTEDCGYERTGPDVRAWKTRRTNPPWFGRTLRTNPPGSGKTRRTNPPDDRPKWENATKEPCLQRRLDWLAGCSQH